MLQIECPWCGPCDEQEFSYGGEALGQRSRDTDAVSDEGRGDSLFLHTNTRGLHAEQWCHSRGCRRWFNVARDSVTYRIQRVYRMGEPRPGFD